MAAPSSERSARIDALRGLAVFGILLINLWGFVYGYTALRYGVVEASATGGDRLAVFFAAAFAEQKFYPVFAFLFGKVVKVPTNGLPVPLFYFSGLLPWKCGVEVIGGPYLHAALTTNFTQFGEGKLFGKERWDREHFVTYAKLYRPAAIVCWTERARSFCR